MIQPGQYKAKVMNYGVTTAQNGNPQIMISFRVFPTESQVQFENMNWWGALVGGARKITLEALAVCGLKSPEQLALVANGKEGGALNTANHVLVTVEQPPDKKFPSISWINSLDGKSIQNTLSQDKFEAFLASNGLKEEFAALQANAPKQEKTHATELSPEDKALLRDIPF